MGFFQRTDGHRNEELLELGAGGAALQSPQLALNQCFTDNSRPGPPSAAALAKQPFSRRILEPFNPL